MSEPGSVPRRLRRAADIRRVFDGRTSAAAGSVVVFSQPSSTGETRVAVIAGRKVGGAVARNRAKRRLRACAQRTSLPRGVDLVLVARATTPSVPFDELCDDLERSLTRCVGRLQARVGA